MHARIHTHTHAHTLQDVTGDTPASSPSPNPDPTEPEYPLLDGDTCPIATPVSNGVNSECPYRTCLRPQLTVSVSYMPSTPTDGVAYKSMRPCPSTLPVPNL